MKSQFKLGIPGLIMVLSILAAGQQAQAFTMVVNEYDAYIIYTQGYWVSGSVHHPNTGALEWIYYHNLVSTDGYAGSDGTWYYIMTFENTELLAYTDTVSGVLTYYGPSGYVRPSDTEPAGGGSLGGAGGSTGGGTGGGGTSGGLLGIPFEEAQPVN